MSSPAIKKRKHAVIFESLERAILSGERRAGDRLPSEHELVEIFTASRPTVARALRELQHAGLIDRRAGSGTFVRQRQPAANGRKLFGLLIPELGSTEIFEPICAGIAQQLQTNGHSLLWGDSGGRHQGASVLRAGNDLQEGLRGNGEVSGAVEGRLSSAEQACRIYIEQGVAGVFFAPVEYASDHGETNQGILDALDKAGIPVVLLDRDAVAFPDRSRYDLVGIDNARGSYLLTQHLIELGHRRIGFVARPRSASTVDRRIAGYRDAMSRAGLSPPASWIQLGDPGDLGFVRTLIKEIRPEALICANDITAARLMQTLIALGTRVPDDVGVVGFDDVKYALLLAVPLTTVQQPCRDLGRVAVNALLERIAQPDLPPRTILLESRVIVRKSCGAA